MAFIIGLVTMVKTARRRIAGRPDQTPITLAEQLAALEPLTDLHDDELEEEANGLLLIGTGPNGDTIPLTDLARPGLGLTGPTAPAAARALIATALTTGTETHSQANVIIPAAVLHRLTATEPLAPIDRLIVTDDHQGLHTAITRETHHRASHQGPHAPVLAVITGESDNDSWHDLVSTAAGVGITTIAIGEWAPATIYIDRDGTTDHPDIDTAFHLDVDTFLSTLDTLTGITATVPPPNDDTDTELEPEAESCNPATAPHLETPMLERAVVNQTASKPATTQLTDDQPPEEPSSTEHTPENKTVVAEDKPPIRLHLFGRITITHQDTEVKGVRKRGRELLAYLAAHAGGASHDDLMEDIVGDMTMRKAANSLNVTISTTRAALRKTLTCGGCASTIQTRLRIGVVGCSRRLR